MADENYKKTYVDVFLLHSRDTGKIPRLIIMADGTRYEIDRMLERRRAASSKVGGTGMRYTIRIGASQTFLFEDEMGWYVEEKA